MTDIVERLRAAKHDGLGDVWNLLGEAADEIERLQTEIWHLRAVNGALKEAARRALERK